MFEFDFLVLTSWQASDTAAFLKQALHATLSSAVTGDGVSI
jgi:hypothetical protein